jgi:hypothetical protein
MSPGKRGSLAGLQPPPAAAPPLPSRPAAPSSSEVQTPGVRSTEVQTLAATKPRGGQRRSPQGQPAGPAEVSGLPKYLRLERKELLIWPDQITKLSILARVLNRTRGGAGERITQNTLIRVAVSLLLSRSQDLVGTTEEELRRSLGLPDLRSPEVRSYREDSSVEETASASSKEGSGWRSRRGGSGEEGRPDLVALVNVLDRHRDEVEAEAHTVSGQPGEIRDAPESVIRTRSDYLVKLTRHFAYATNPIRLLNSSVARGPAGEGGPSLWPGG